jgi:hypothetical protein
MPMGKVSRQYMIYAKLPYMSVNGKIRVNDWKI